MKIEKLRVNHIERPLGYLMDKIVFSWVVTRAEGTFQKCARVRIGTEEEMMHLVYDSGEREDMSSLGFEAEFQPKACTRYYWDVTVTDDMGNTQSSPVSWFETAKGEESIEGEWISTPFDKKTHPTFQKKFYIGKTVKTARFYGTALGLFEFYVNGCKAGDEYLAPFYNDYNNWLQYVTYDITELLRQGENAVGAILGNGWYKGRFGCLELLDELYGDTFQFLAEIRIEYDDGSIECVGTDTSWKCSPCEIQDSNIYDGEIIDANKKIEHFATMSCDVSEYENALLGTGTEARLIPRLSPEISVVECRKPIQLLHTPKGECVLDFGQVMTGWVEVDVNLPKGVEICLQYGELLQEECFYNGNLRTAKQEFRYTSKGMPEHVRPHFTYYGFRYVKVSGFREIELDNFVACVLYSKMNETGYIETSNPKVNQLISNTKWGQKGNFLDVPTDCPQRDERLGWTGDAQIFCATANFHMYTPAFYRKYMYDMYLEQKNLDGAVPNVVPDIIEREWTKAGKNTTAKGACGWGDAATIIPWTTYLFYGDKSLLAEQYDSMKMWVNYIRSQDVEHCGGEYLWKCGIHYGDWLSLDSPDKNSTYGGTDKYYVASAYYFYSALLTAKVAEVLGKEADAIYFKELSQKVKQAIQKEYFTEDGMLQIDTQTAYVLALYFEFAPENSREQLVRELKRKLDENDKHLNTGFVGTAYLCLILTEVGLSDYAYTLLFNEDYPSWLYEVNMGATTIWERWNSVLPNGLVSDTGMNSMNHYAYGAVAEWMYRCIGGLNPVWETPGFKRARISPQTDKRMDWAKTTYESASGNYVSEWRREENKCIFRVQVPFDSKATFSIPEEYELISINGEAVKNTVEIELTAGTYELVGVLR